MRNSKCANEVQCEVWKHGALLSKIRIIIIQTKDVSYQVLSIFHPRVEKRKGLQTLSCGWPLGVLPRHLSSVSLECSLRLSLTVTHPPFTQGRGAKQERRGSRVSSANMNFLHEIMRLIQLRGKHSFTFALP